MKEQQASSSWAVIVVIVILAIPFLLFLPLGLAFVEMMLFETRHVEEFCHAIGIHAFLSDIYQPVLVWLDFV